MLHYRTSSLLRMIFLQMLVGIAVLNYGLSPHGFITDDDIPSMLLLGMSGLNGLEAVQAAFIMLALFFFFDAMKTCRYFHNAARADFTVDGLRLHTPLSKRIFFWKDVVGVDIAPTVPPVSSGRGPYLKIEFRDPRYNRPVNLPVSLRDLRESEAEVQRWVDEANNRRRIALAYA